MTAFSLLVSSFFLIACSYMCVFAQETRGPKEPPNSKENGSETPPAANNSKEQETQPITIALVGGGEILVEEVTETQDGYWYKRGTISTFLDRSKVERIKRPTPESNSESSDASIQGNGKWRLADAARIKSFFLTTFNRPLPLSAFGQSDLHDRWGLDHRNGMDVGLHPDSPEGRALITFLRAEAIPFLAFRNAIPRVATGPHIHIGNRSPRVSVH